jgi:hypothetical protein
MRRRGCAIGSLECIVAMISVLPPGRTTSDTLDNGIRLDDVWVQSTEEPHARAHPYIRSPPLRISFGIHAVAGARCCPTKVLEVLAAELSTIP